MITQFVFVGHHKERLIESIRALRELPTDKIILFVGEDELPGEEKVRKLAKELKKELEVVWDVEIKKIDKKNVIRSALQLIEKINKERQDKRDVVINASGSLRTLAIAGYIAACVTNSRIFTSVPKYNENEEEIGIEEVIEIPTLPIDIPAKEQTQILVAIDGGVNALDELIERINLNIAKNSDEFFKERSRISHHIAKLERIGAVKKRKVGRNVRIELTPLGRFLVSGVDKGGKINESKKALMGSD